MENRCSLEKECSNAQRCRKVRFSGFTWPQIRFKAKTQNLSVVPYFQSCMTQQAGTRTRITLVRTFPGKQNVVKLRGAAGTGSIPTSVAALGK